MPSVIAPDGTTVYIPGVYQNQEVISDLPGATPEFHIPVVIGDANMGHPYNAQDLKYANEDAFSPFRLCKTTAAVEAYYGKGSEIAKAFRIAKRHGLPFAYCCAINAMTRASIVATSTGPVDELTLFSKTFGAVGGHHKVTVTVTPSSITITPVKRHTLLTSNAAATDKRIYVQDNSWAAIGQSYELGDNTQANQAFVVADKGEEYDSNGQIVYWIEATAAVGAIFATAQYAMLVEYDTVNVEESGTITTGQEFYDFLNDTSKYVGAKKEATFSDVVLIAQAIKPMKEIAAWNAPTDGTSPAGTVTEHDDLISDLDASEWDNFLLTYGVVPQAFLVVDGSSTIHASWRDWAATKRAEGWPVSFTVGCDWGDTDVTGNVDTNSRYRAQTLNSQDMMLCAGGMDFQASYLSTAPAVFGRRIGGGLNHNLTNDELLYSNLEKIWDERSSGELTLLTRSGVVTQRLRVAGNPRYVVSEGLSTLQNNGSSWNTVTNDTPLVMQRDLADFFDRVTKEDLDGTQVGADAVSADSIAAVLRNRVEKTLERKNYVVKGSYTISEIALQDSGAGYDVTHQVQFPTTLDFITTNTQILVGE